MGNCCVYKGTRTSSNRDNHLRYRPAAQNLEVQPVPSRTSTTDNRVSCSNLQHIIEREPEGIH